MGGERGKERAWVLQSDMSDGREWEKGNCEKIQGELVVIHIGSLSLVLCPRVCLSSRLCSLFCSQTLQSFWLWTLLFSPAKHCKSSDKLKTLKSDFDKVIECVSECASAWGWCCRKSSMVSLSETGGWLLLRHTPPPYPMCCQNRIKPMPASKSKEIQNAKTWYEIICQQLFQHFISFRFRFALTFPFPIFVLAFWFCGRDAQKGKGTRVYQLYSLHSCSCSSVSVSIRVAFPWNCMPNGADMQWQTSNCSAAKVVIAFKCFISLLKIVDLFAGRGGMGAE